MFPSTAASEIFRSLQLCEDMKNVPGRKTDVNDAEWIADLLQHGLLQASYIPDKDQRELRELVRYRKSLVGERTRELNRLQKMLEGANIKLSGTVSNINGKSARAILEHVNFTDNPFERMMRQRPGTDSGHPCKHCRHKWECGYLLHQCRKKFRSVLGDTAPPAAGAVRP